MRHTRVGQQRHYSSQVQWMSLCQINIIIYKSVICIWMFSKNGRNESWQFVAFGLNFLNFLSLITGFQRIVSFCFYHGWYFITNAHLRIGSKTCTRNARSVLIQCPLEAGREFGGGGCPRAPGKGGRRRELYCSWNFHSISPSPWCNRVILHLTYVYECGWKGRGKLATDIKMFNIAKMGRY